LPQTFHVAVVEYDSGTTPTRIVATSLETVEAAAVQSVVAFLADYDGEFLSKHPAPNLHNAQAVSDWLETLRNDTCVPWVSVEEVPLIETI
jgi:hypothetical protein